MKKLSDYKGEEAFELWADLMEPIVHVLQDEEVIRMMRDRASRFRLAAYILREHKEEAVQITERIDPEEPVNGLNLIVKVVRLLAEIGSDPIVADFFGSPESEKTE